ncbi:MAG: alpha/beta hydrolase [Verrucomicrobiales bacterium]|nr:alpha/beta hydrolase [Verrucomicrobiales bacterium]
MAGSFDSLTSAQQQLLEQAQGFAYRKTKSGEELKIHFYLPKGLKEGPKRPVFLFFFSGNWDRGNIVQFAPHALHFVERGAVCGLVEYSTRTTHPESTPMDSALDGMAAVRFVRKYKDQLHIDSSKVIVMGAGAGGNIAGCAALGAKLKDASEDLAGFSSVPNACALLSSIIDIKKTSFAFKQFSDKPSEAKKLSLSSMVDHSPPCPFVMIHGTADRMTSIDDAEAFAAKMQRRKKSDFEFHAFEGRDSNFYNLNMDPMSFEAALNIIDRFLVNHLFLEMNDDPNGASLVSWREQDF